MNTFKLKELSVSVCLVSVMVLAGCHKKVVAPPPPTPPPPPPAAPTASINVTRQAIERGQSAVLSWTTTNATSASIDGVGAVTPNGSQSVSPTTSTSYTLTAKGPEGSVQASTRITVNIPPPTPPPAPLPPSMTEDQIFEQNMHDVYFDYDKSTLRAQDLPIVVDDARFLSQHPDMKVVIGGHCDERGSAEYNIALGQSRAISLEKLLEDKGVPASQLRVVSYGKEKPFCSESTEECWQQNRRDHLVLDK